MKFLKFKNAVYVFLTVLFAITACKKSHTPTPSSEPVINNPNVDVYVAGTSSPDGSATYWKNGVPTYLNGDKANAILVNGLEVYVAGQSRDVNGNFIATYWVNGSPVHLPGVDANALAIAVDGTDVYITGNTMTSSGGQAIYWKNGIATPLPSGSVNLTGAAEAIAINNGDVYIAGYTLDANLHFVATLWKNGIPSFLPSGTNHDAAAYAIKIDGNDVYIVGTSANTSAGQNFFSYTSSNKALLWKNGVVTTLDDNSSNSGANAIAISGSDVYIGGYSNDSNGNLLSTYWKNGKETKIPLLTQQFSIYSTTGIAVQGQDVYVSGELGAYPGYWVNGTPVQFDKNINPSGAAFTRAIAVVPN